MRLSHFLSQQGVASRRKAEGLIAAGKVSVNGKVIREQGTKVDPAHDRVVVDGQPIRAQKSAPQLILFHKPRNVMVTKKDPEGRPTIFDYLKDLPNNFNPVGRLDFDSEGLILLTNDGAIHQRLSHPSFEVSKVYEVKVAARLLIKAHLQRCPTRPRSSRTTKYAAVLGSQAPCIWDLSQQPENLASLLERLTTGIQLEDGLARCDRAQVIKENPHNTWIRVSIHQGRNRIIRRMCEAVGLNVLRLKRIAVGPYELGSLPAGGWKRLPYQKGG